MASAQRWHTQIEKCKQAVTQLLIHCLSRPRNKWIQTHFQLFNVNYQVSNTCCKSCYMIYGHIQIHICWHPETLASQKVLKMSWPCASRWDHRRHGANKRYRFWRRDNRLWRDLLIRSGPSSAFTDVRCRRSRVWIPDWAGYGWVSPFQVSGG